LSPSSPARLASRWSVTGLAAAAFSLFLGCGEPPPPPFDFEEPLRQELGIDPGVPIHRITLGGRGADDRVVPLRVEGAPGDVLHVLSVDRRVQTFAFEAEGMSAEQKDFLERTGQVGSPPLTDAGSRWVVSLEGAPEGDYPFVVMGQGEPVRGMVDVRRRR
jgi:hypothetical protein